MASYRQKTTGTENLMGHRATRPLVLSAVVTAKASTGTLIRKRGPNETERRSAGDNVTILRYHAKHGRNVVFLDAKDEARGIEAWRRACEAAIDGQEHGLMRHAAAVAQIQVDAIREHVQQGRRARGRVKPNKRGTEKRKERETGKKGLPVLYRTGQLMESLTTSVRKLKG
jgi:hypothetical protein